MREILQSEEPPDSVDIDLFETDHETYFDDNYYDDPIYSTLCSRQCLEEVDQEILDLLVEF